MFASGIYLLAIVSANLTLVVFGPAFSIINAFLFIGLDLTLRDRLHEAWGNQGLIWKMPTLITIGSAITILMNLEALQIAIASAVAFWVSSLADALVYSRLKGKDYYLRVNGSNVVGAGIDSLIFPVMAFGSFAWLIFLGQFSAKVFGGAIWSWLLNKIK